MLKIRGKRGFTLIEMMVVVAILGIMAAIAIPNFRQYIMQSRLNGAARQVMSDFMSARMTAVSQNRKVKIFFFSNHQYKICDDADNNGTVSDGEGTVQTRDVQNDYPGVTFTSTADPIFNLNGTANGTTITLTNPSGTRTVSLATTGRAMIQ